MPRAPGQPFHALVGHADRRGVGTVLLVALLPLVGSAGLFLSCSARSTQMGGQAPQTGARPIAGAPRTLPSSGAHAVNSSTFHPNLVYSATPRGLFVSDDRGESWSPLPVDGTHEEVFSVAVHPTDPDVVYSGRRDGLWQSRDGGRSWTPLAYPSPRLYIPLAVAIAESRPDVIYVATARQGIYQSADGGDSWVNASKGLPEARAGGRPAEIRSLVVDPRNPDTAYIAHERRGVYRTTEEGRNWHPFNQGLPLPRLRSTYPPRLAFDPDDPNRLYMVFGHRIHSHLVRNRVYVTSPTGGWLPVEVELPANTAFVGLTVDRGRRALHFWAQDAVWEFPLRGQP